MPVCAMPNSDGFIAIVEGVELSSCSGYVMTTVQEYNALYEYTQLTGVEISQYFGLGFSLVFVGGYLLTYGISAALKVIRLL